VTGQVRIHAAIMAQRVQPQVTGAESLRSSHHLSPPPSQAVPSLHSGPLSSTDTKGVRTITSHNGSELGRHKDLESLHHVRDREVDNGKVQTQTCLPNLCCHSLSGRTLLPLDTSTKSPGCAGQTKQPRQCVAQRLTCGR
jgi:hypothetical protein